MFTLSKGEGAVKPGLTVKPSSVHNEVLIGRFVFIHKEVDVVRAHNSFVAPTGAYLVHSLIALGLLAIALMPQPSRAAVVIEGDSLCIDQNRLGAKLNGILAANAAGRQVDVLVAVAIKRDGNKTVVRLAVFQANGKNVVDARQFAGAHPAIERKYELFPEDCASSIDLLAAVLERFVSTLPLDKWTIEKAAPKAVVAVNAAKQSLVYDIGMSLNAHLALFLIGGGAELGLFGAVGGERHQFYATLSLRSSFPVRLGVGSFIGLSPLLGLGWRFAYGHLRITAGIAGGPILFAGFNYPSNKKTWLPWVEVVNGYSWNIGLFSLGPFLAIAFMRHQVATANQVSSMTFPNVRLGLAFSFTLRHGADRRK
jgi:hypothetical protein